MRNSGVPFHMQQRGSLPRPRGPRRCKEGFWPQAKADAVVRLWAASLLPKAVQGGFGPKPNRRRYPPLGFISRREMSAAVSPSVQPKPAQGGPLASAKGHRRRPVLGADFPPGKCPQLETGGRRPTIPAAKDGIGTVSRSACARLTGKAEPAAPQPFPLPRKQPTAVDFTGTCKRHGEIGPERRRLSGKAKAVIRSVGSEGWREGRQKRESRRNAKKAASGCRPRFAPAHRGQAFLPGRTLKPTRSPAGRGGAEDCK